MRSVLVSLLSMLALAPAHARMLPNTQAALPITKAAFTMFSLNGGGGGGGGGSVPFTALHTYFISPTGNDANPGTLGSPWKTAGHGHSIVCGDVTIALAGPYGNSGAGTSPFDNDGGLNDNWSTPTVCPSITGGIDGTGGIYFAILLCAGPTLTSCPVNAGAGTPFWVTASNWAVSGFTATNSTAGNFNACYTNASNSSTLNFFAVVNSIANVCNFGGITVGSSSYPVGSVDHVLTLGDIVFNAATSLNSGGNCTSGMSLIVAPSGSGLEPHVLTAGSFIYGNKNSVSGGVCPTGALNSDGEGLIWDSLGVGSYNHGVVARDNVAWGNGGAGIATFPAGNTASTDLAQYAIYHNTLYGNVADTNHVAGAELSNNQVSPSGTGTYTITENIAVGTHWCPGTTSKTSCSANYSSQTFNGNSSAPGGNVGFFIGNYPGATVSLTPFTVTGNWLWNNVAPTTTAVGGNNTWVCLSNGVCTGGTLTSNTFNNPGLASPGSLPTGAPSCGSDSNVYDCMVRAGVIAAIVPSIAPTTIGYQSPGGCAPDALYPVWAKGINYLKWDGSSITENTGLTNKPCGS